MVFIYELHTILEVGVRRPLRTMAHPGAKWTPEKVEEQPPIIILNSEHAPCGPSCMLRVFCMISFEKHNVLEFYRLGSYIPQRPPERRST